jgi:hypothetical protein
MTTPRPTHCDKCKRPVHSRGTRKDDRPEDSVLYRGLGLCTECASARATSGNYGKFQLHKSHLITNPEPEPRPERDPS